jgi:hypothetical protein
LGAVDAAVQVQAGYLVPLKKPTTIVPTVNMEASFTFKESESQATIL